MKRESMNEEFKRWLKNKKNLFRLIEMVESKRLECLNCGHRFETRKLWVDVFCPKCRHGLHMPGRKRGKDLHKRKRRKNIYFETWRPDEDEE